MDFNLVSLCNWKRSISQLNKKLTGLFPSELIIFANSALLF